MRYFSLAGLALAAALVLPELAAAQEPRVEITGVRIGYPGSLNRLSNRAGAQGRFKSGAWAPVYVDLEVRDASLKAGSYVLVVRTTDSDDMQNVYTEKRFLPTIEPKESPTLLAYVRMASSFTDVTVEVMKVGTEQVLRSKKLSQGDIDPLPGSVYGYLTLGDRARTLYKSLNPTKKQGMGVGGGLPGAGFDNAPLDEAADPNEEANANRFFAHFDQVQQMPTYWFGYQSADTVVLLTSKQQFATDLNSGKQDDPFSVRREALAEWVRRGGKLIVSVSQNHQEVKQILDQMKIIDLAVEGRTQLPGLPGVARWVGTNSPFQGIVPKGQTVPIVEIAKLKPGPGVQVLAYDRENGGPGALPVIVQAPCGLGRVIVTAFDLNEPPFTTWRGGREEFWKKIRDITEPANIGDQPIDNNPFRGGGFNNQNNTELAGKLVKSLENFPDVPVISFGWVALFILVYIIIVGPLDYFFLKKVVKRLELTWITFPAVVIVISAVAYFAAYYLKGNDLRINKIDVVDVDLRGGHVYGSTWFTLFSPRIQNYTIGVEPGTGWGPEETDPKKFSPLVGWMGRPEEGWPGGGRGGSQGLFRRAYNYAPDLSKTYADQPAAGGLIGVPIQVWSTKTFTASWFHAIKEDELIEARIGIAKDNPEKVSGTITSHLPVELRDVVFFYKNSYYPLDNLIPGTPQRIDGKMAQIGKTDTWLSQGLGAQNVQPNAKKSSSYYNQDPAQPVGSYVKSILFSTSLGDKNQQGVRNSGLRSLDEKWRLDPANRDELMVFGRAVPPPGKGGDGPAEEVSLGGLSASKLWLGKLPGTGKRDPLAGTLSQDTYVRIYIPVNTSR